MWGARGPSRVRGPGGTLGSGLGGTWVGRKERVGGGHRAWKGRCTRSTSARQTRTCVCMSLFCGYTELLARCAFAAMLLADVVSPRPQDTWLMPWPEAAALWLQHDFARVLHPSITGTLPPAARTGHVAAAPLPGHLP